VRHEEILPTRRGAFLAAMAFATLVVGALLWWVLDQWRPLPPRQFVMTTGAEGSAYVELGEEYREILAQDGITVHLRASAGDVENLNRLDDPASDVDVGFLQGGLTDRKKSPGLVSLGTLMYQPLWVFYRWQGKPADGYLEELKDHRVSIGPDLSGTRALTTALLLRAGIDTDSALLLPLTPEEAEDQLRHGKIDAAVILSGWEAPAVQRLLVAPGIRLMPLRRADAFVALYPHIEKVVLPEGTGDMALDNPPADITLLADKTSLVVRRTLHPAIQYLLLDAAEQIHARPGVFNAAGEFPAPEAIDLPLSSDARQFYKSGRPLAQRYLPFWLAALVERLVVLLVPLLGLMYPLARLAPAVYAWSIRRRVLGLYSELRLLELEAGPSDQPQVPGDFLGRLDSLEQRAHRLHLPIAYSPMLYTLRDHITLVRRRVEGG